MTENNHSLFGLVILLMEENLVNNGINYQPQLVNAGFSSINSNNLTPVQTRPWVCIFVVLASIAGEDSGDLGVFNFWRSRSSKAPRWNHETMRNTIETFLSSRMMVDGWLFFKGFIYMLLHRLLLRIFPDFLGVVCTHFAELFYCARIFLLIFGCCLARRSKTMFNSQWSSRLLVIVSYDDMMCSLDAPVHSKRQRRPTRIQDPYGYSSLGLMQAANKEEFLKACDTQGDFLYSFTAGCSDDSRDW